MGLMKEVMQQREQLGEHEQTITAQKKVIEKKQEEIDKLINKY